MGAVILHCLASAGLAHLASTVLLSEEHGGDILGEHGFTCK